VLHEIRGEGLLDAMNTGQAAVMWHSTVGMAPQGTGECCLRCMWVMASRCRRVSGWDGIRGWSAGLEVRAPRSGSAN